MKKLPLEKDKSENVGEEDYENDDKFLEDFFEDVD